LIEAPTRGAPRHPATGVAQAPTARHPIKAYEAPSRSNSSTTIWSIRLKGPPGRGPGLFMGRFSVAKDARTDRCSCWAMSQTRGEVDSFRRGCGEANRRFWFGQENGRPLVRINLRSPRS
jgi:hypothetical protein